MRASFAAGASRRGRGPLPRGPNEQRKKIREFGAPVEDSTQEWLEWISGDAVVLVVQGIGGRRLDHNEFWSSVEEGDLQVICMYIDKNLASLLVYSTI